MSQGRQVGAKFTSRTTGRPAAGRLLTALLAVVVFLPACGGGSPTAPSAVSNSGGTSNTGGGTTGGGTTGGGTTGGGNTGGGNTGGGNTGGGNTGTPSNASLLVGTWRVLTSSGVDVTGLNATWTLTATTMVENYPGICQKSYTYTATATTISSTVTANSCTFSGSNEPVGFQGTSTYAFSNGNNTLTVTVPATGAFGTLQRVG